LGDRLRGFDLSALLSRHSERRIRIIDMIARRGRTALLIGVGFAYVYLETLRAPGPDSLVAGLQAGVFDSIVMNGLGLAGFHNQGVLGRMMYGAQARVLDGVQGRANALCIGTLWSAFRFVMVPLGVVLSGLYAPSVYAVLFAFIWITYAAADFASEIFGSLFGRHNIRVWGLGDLNRKSWEGVVAGFLCALVTLVAIVWSQQLPASWYLLAVVLAVTNPIVELLSPRGSDDFTMATFNAIVCVAFGWWVF
jgi:CDP-diglyceride synthetase